MNAIRQTVKVKTRPINIELPKDFDAEIANVIILPKKEELKLNLPESFYEEMEKRRQKHLNGESKSYTWEDVKAKISAQRNAI